VFEGQGRLYSWVTIHGHRRRTIPVFRWKQYPLATCLWPSLPDAGQTSSITSCVFLFCSESASWSFSAWHWVNPHCPVESWEVVTVCWILVCSDTLHLSRVRFSIRGLTVYWLLMEEYVTGIGSPEAVRTDSRPVFLFISRTQYSFVITSSHYVYYFVIN